MLPDAFEDEMAVLISNPVEWDLEIRCFCLDGKVLTGSPYLRNGEFAESTGYAMTNQEWDAARETVEQVLKYHNLGLPKAIVIDVGIIRGHGWSVVEANGAWGAGIYGCDPNAVLDAIRHATVKNL